MKIRTIVAGSVMVLTLGLVGCSGAPTALDAGGRIERSELSGRWENTETGRIVAIRSATGSSYIVDVEETDSRSDYRFSLHPIARATVSETVIHKGKRDEPTVYIYGILETDGQEITHRVMSDEWLESRAGAGSGLTFVRMDADGSEPPHGVVATDGADMRRLLIEAVNDENAWEAPERWVKVK